MPGAHGHRDWPAGSAGFVPYRNAGAAAPGGARIAGHIAGSVNRIFRVETLAGSFALRVRHNEANFPI